MTPARDPAAAGASITAAAARRYAARTGAIGARIGAVRHPVRAGAFIACPPGGRETAHQLVDTRAVELRVLAVSTKRSPEVVHDPDSGKSALPVETRSDADGPATREIHRWHDGDSAPYRDGE